jgi:hypothetical protein
MISNFPHFETHHCVTGSMRHMYAFHQHPISEEMLLGLGEGVGFIYWHPKGSDPFLGGRGTPKPSMEELTGQRTGVRITPHNTDSAAKARHTLLELLDSGEPVMLQLDMGFLPYFDFDGQEYHFGGHAVVACGYDSTTQTVLIADRDKELHPVPLDKLEAARGSKYKPFPPHNRWYTFDFSEKHDPTPEDIYTAIQHQADLMLNPPIQNIGIAGIRKAARLIPSWATIDHLVWVLFNGYIFISPVGGSGGGNFRYMFSRFLSEASQITQDERIAESAVHFKTVADRWAAVGECFKAGSEMDDPVSALSDIAAMLLSVADLEESAWAGLRNTMLEKQKAATIR